MHRLFSLILAIAPLSAFAESDSNEYIHGEFEGIYYSGFEVSNFVPCHLNERWWLAAEKNEIWDMLDRSLVKWNDATTIKYVYLRVFAKITPDQEAGRRTGEFDVFIPSGHGHLGLYDRDIVVGQILESRAPTREDISRCTAEGNEGYPEL